MTTPDDETTVTEPVRCPICGARYTQQDLVLGHKHRFPPVGPARAGAHRRKGTP